MFKKLFVSLSLVAAVLGFFVMPLQAAAQTQKSVTNDILRQVDAAAGDDGAAIGKPVDPRYVVTYIIRVALGLVGTILFALDIYAGYLWMTAGGNEEQVAQAKTTLRNSTIGLVIIFTAYAITLAVTNLAAGNTISTGANTQLDPETAAKQGNWSWW